MRRRESADSRWAQWLEKEQRPAPIAMSSADKDSLLAKASRFADIDAALACVQAGLRIDDASLPDKFFDKLDRDRWVRMTPGWREILLDRYFVFANAPRPAHQESSPLWGERFAYDCAGLRWEIAMLMTSRPLSTRAFNCLAGAGIFSIDDLLEKSAEQLAREPNLGKGILAEIKTLLREAGLHLRSSK
jgi:hypothetical protein